MLLRQCMTQPLHGLFKEEVKEIKEKQEKEIADHPQELAKEKEKEEENQEAKIEDTSHNQKDQESKQEEPDPKERAPRLVATPSAPQWKPLKRPWRPSLVVQLSIGYRIPLIAHYPDQWQGACEVVDVVGPSTSTATVRVVLPTVEQARWDAWDILADLYAGHNEAKIALLRKELESTIMNEEDDMDSFLTGVKDIHEQLISVGEDISDSSLVQTVLDALPDSYHTFASSGRLMNQRNLEAVKFDEVCTLMLQETLFKKNKTRQCAVEQAFIAAQRKGGNSNARGIH
ncbi:hypothetical protein L7F22_003794 [Adiantum nelumboides]|nr:hypothetical protein [Adiantum nelumboides]